MRGHFPETHVGAVEEPGAVPGRVVGPVPRLGPCGHGGPAVPTEARVVLVDPACAGQERLPRALPHHVERGLASVELGDRLAVEIGLGGRGPEAIGELAKVPGPAPRVERHNIEIRLVVRTVVPDVVRIRDKGVRASVAEEGEEMALVPTAAVGVVPLPLVEHLIEHVREGLQFGDQPRTEPLLEVLVLLCAAPSGVHRLGHLPAVVGQLDVLAPVRQGAVAQGAVERMPVEAGLGPTVVDRDEDQHAPPLRLADELPEPLEVDRVEPAQVEAAVVGRPHPRPSLGGIVAQSGVAPLACRVGALVAPEHEQVDPARRQGLDVGRLVKVGPALHPALRHRIAAGQDRLPPPHQEVPRPRARPQDVYGLIAVRRRGHCAEDEQDGVERGESHSPPVAVGPASRRSRCAVGRGRARRPSHYNTERGFLRPSRVGIV